MPVKNRQRRQRIESHFLPAFAARKSKLTKSWQIGIIKYHIYHRLTRANTPGSVSFRRFLPFSPWRAPARLRLKSQKSLENPLLAGAGQFCRSEMRPDKERPAENTDVLSRSLTLYGRISASQNRVCPCHSMVINTITCHKEAQWIFLKNAMLRPWPVS